MPSGRRSRVMELHLKVKLDRESCLGDAICTAILPGVFEMDSEGKAYLAGAVEGKDNDLQEAASLCPARVISLMQKD